MSEPAKKFDQAPEGYSPKGKPEIISMAQEAAVHPCPERFLLEKVVRDAEPFPGKRCPEMQPFATAIRAFLDYTGQDFGYEGYPFGRLDIAFTLIDTLSGEAYADDRHMGHSSAQVADYEGYKNMFRSLGYEGYEVVHTSDYGKDALKRRIMETLVREKTPVIVDNFTPCPNGCAVIGYEQNGDILVGWNYNVFDFSENPQPQLFKKENWYEEAAYAAFIGKRTGDPALQDLYRQGVATAYHAMTEDGAALRYAQSFDDWKRRLTRTKDMCLVEAAVDPAWCAYSERRYYAKFFMRQAKAHLPEHAEILEEIARCFERISHKHMEEFIKPVGNPVDRKKLRRPAVRTKMAKLIDKCRAEEEKAMTLLKQIIGDMEGYSPKAKPDILKLAAQQSGPHAGPAENVLRGIPKMRYGDPAAVCFIGSVLRLMDYLGDPVDHSELFALSGVGLCFPWQYGSCCDEVSVIPAIPQRTFAALGYESEYYYEPDISAGERKHSKEFYVDRIRRSIDAGRPVLGFGFTAEVFTCLITGYYNGGEGLYLRSFWSPEGKPEGYDEEQYYSVGDWYGKCHGILVVGERTGERLTGEKAYAHIQETAKLFSKMTSVSAQGQVIHTGFSAFDAMIEWLRGESRWDDLGRADVFLKPCGVLLLQYYRDHLRLYLEQLSEQHPGLVHPGIVPAVHRMGEMISGKERSDWLLGKDIDPRLRKFSNMRRRELREKVAACVIQLKEIDREIFACLAEEDYSPKAKPAIVNLAQALQSDTLPSDAIADPFAGNEPPRASNRITQYRKIQPWENYFLASALCSMGKLLGSGHDLHFYSAITGDMFTYLYSSKRTPCDSGVTADFFAPQVVKKAYAAMGYDCIYLSTEYIKLNFRTVMNAIKASVDRGIPVLSWGMGNVSFFNGGYCDFMSEGCLIGGYGEGDLLYVNLYCGPERVETDDDGYTAITGGLETTLGLFFVGEPIEKTHMAEVYREAIASIPTLLTLPPKDDFVFGQTAFETWADALLDESNFEGKTDAEIEGLGVTWDIHCAPYCTVCTSNALKFVKTAAKEYKITAAKKRLPLYKKFTKRRQRIWKLQKSFFPPVEKFRQRAFREKIAALLREMGALCAEIAAV